VLRLLVLRVNFAEQDNALLLVQESIVPMEKDVLMELARLILANPKNAPPAKFV